MKLTVKLIAAAVALAASAGANAALDNFQSGNSSLAFIALDSTGSPISAMMDLDYNLDGFLPTAMSAAGTHIVWNFNTNSLTVNGITQSGAQTGWSGAMNSFYATAQNAETKWGVIGGDSLSNAVAGDVRYVSTTNTALATVQGMTKVNLQGFSLVDLLYNSNNILQASVNGSTATSGAAYVGSTGSFGVAGKWQNKANFVALANEGTAQSFYMLDTNNGTSASRALVTPYAGTFSYAAGVLSYDVADAVPAVPEPETYAMFLAGLGLMGAIARRRLNRA